jgi:hypothetical protein
MSLLSTVLTRVGYRIGGGLTISSTSDPNETTFIAWVNETALWLTGVCAENNSDLGRTTGTITTIAADISAATQAANCQITATSHGLCTTGQTAEVVIKDVVGMTELNDTEFTFTFVSANAGTLGVASSVYTAYSSGGYVSKRKFNTLASTLYCPTHLTDPTDGEEYSGWIVKKNSRSKLKLVTEADIINYDPVEAMEPAAFYVDGSNNICFPSYPNDVYTIKIPYYTLPTALTTSGDTMPFLGIFDNVFIEDLALRAMNRDEYDTKIELSWRSFLVDMARKAIAMRKKMGIGVGL